VHAKAKTKATAKTAGKEEARASADIAAPASASASVSVSPFSPSSSASASSHFVCHDCQPIRMFKDVEAMQQHRLARHAATVGSINMEEPDASTALSTPDQMQPADGGLATSSSDVDAPDASIPPSSASPICCPICSLRFPSPSALHTHLLGIPPIPIRRVECSRCARLFPNQRALNQHVKATHTHTNVNEHGRGNVSNSNAMDQKEIEAGKSTSEKEEEEALPDTRTKR